MRPRLAGTKLGAFNLVYDPRAAEQLLIGTTGANGFEVWSSFISRSFRGRAYVPEFTVSDYRIEAKLDPDLTLHATTRVTVKPVLDERNLPFEMTEKMHATSATVNGAPAEVLTAGHTGFFVVIPSVPLRAGEPVEVAVQHEGKVIEDAGNHVFSVQSRGSWYPNRGRQFARFDLSFHVPKDLNLVAAGDLTEDRIEGSERISRWKTSVPIRLAGFNLGVYDRVRITSGDLTIEVCANKSAETSLAARSQEPPVRFPPLPQSRGMRRSQVDELAATPPAVVTPKMRLQALAAEMGDVMAFFTARFGPLDLNDWR